MSHVAKHRPGDKPATHPTIESWLHQVAADHDGMPLIVAKAVAAIMVDASSDHWIALRRVCDITGLPSNTVAGILYRLRDRGRLGFDRRGAEVRAEFRFTVPTEMQPIVERVRVWDAKRPEPVAIPDNFPITVCAPGKTPKSKAWSTKRSKWAIRKSMQRRA